jgi:hypothetical protein
MMIVLLIVAIFLILILYLSLKRIDGTRAGRRLTILCYVLSLLGLIALLLMIWWGI